MVISFLLIATIPEISMHDEVREKEPDREGAFAEIS